MKTILITCLVTLQITAFCQQKIIEVNGAAEKEFVPDIIVLGVRLREYEEDRQKVLLDKIDKDFQQAVRNAGIEEGNIELFDITASAYIYRRKDHTIYSQKTYHIKFSDAAQVMNFLDRAKDVRLDHIGVVMLSHTDIEKMQLDLKLAALRAAEKNAHEMLSSLSLGERTQLGKPTLIRELDQTVKEYRPSPAHYAEKADFSNITASGESEIPLRKITIRFSVTTQWEIL